RSRGGENWLLLCVLFGLLVQADAHPMPFITCRAEVTEADRTLRLRFAVDHAANPLVRSEEEARAALHGALWVMHGGKSTPLSDLATLQIHTGSTWQELLPPGLLPPDDGQPHEIMTADWSWQPDCEEVFFTVKKGSLHDVLLWQQPRGAEVRSILLLGGDVSPAFRFPMQPSLLWVGWLAVGVVAGCLALALGLRRPAAGDRKALSL
ncbi:MAG: hypothetical protein LDL31_05580, partial [Prosthecobacter sp.]|nr:hypothetical protein [Prosthecobacter sp.]